MEYRKLPHGNEHEKLSVLGLGLGAIQNTASAESEVLILQVDKLLYYTMTIRQSFCYKHI